MKRSIKLDKLNTETFAKSDNMMFSKTRKENLTMSGNLHYVEQWKMRN